MLSQVEEKFGLSVNMLADDDEEEIASSSGEVRMREWPWRINWHRLV